MPAGGRGVARARHGAGAMKIGVTCYPTYGGSGAVATELGIGLAARGHEIHFISYAQPFRLSRFHERVYFHEVKMEAYPLFEHNHYALALAAAIHETMRREGLDVVHVHYAVPHATSAWVAREMAGGESAPPLVTTLHGTDVTLVGTQPSFNDITRFSILRSQAITAVSRFLKRVTVRDFDVPADRIRVIPNFVDTNAFRPQANPARRKIFAPEGEKIAMHISNFRPVKRVRDVVEVFARIRAQVPARLVMVGDGPDRPRAAKRVGEMGLDRHVVFLGKHASVEELLSCADLFLLTSETESFGLVALEAMSCGVPVVGYGAGGLGEVVSHGENGLLVPVGGLDEAAEAGRLLLSDAPTWDRFSAAGRAAAVERFAIEKVLPRYESLYRDLLS